VEPFIEWKPSWNTAIPKIDHQHNEMAVALNAIVDQLKNATTTPTESAVPLKIILSEFTQLTREHFRTEEMLIHSIDFPHYSSHIKEHVALQAEPLQL